MSDLVRAVSTEEPFPARGDGRSRPAVRRSPGTSTKRAERNLVARITARRPAGTSARRPLDLAPVVDARAAMQSTEPAADQAAASDVVAGPASADRLSLVSFASAAIAPLELRAMGADGALFPANPIATVETRGDNDPSEARLSGAEAPTCFGRGPKAVARAVLLSDGTADEDVGDPDELRRHER